MLSGDYFNAIGCAYCKTMLDVVDCGTDDGLVQIDAPLILSFAVLPIKYDYISCHIDDCNRAVVGLKPTDGRVVKGRFSSRICQF